ncbi:TPA: hypothetical protein ACH3X1_001165 [Trebouxia sp. C0004]
MHLGQIALVLLLIHGCEVLGRPIEIPTAETLRWFSEHTQLYTDLGSLAAHNTIHVLQVSSTSLKSSDVWVEQLQRRNVSSFLLVTLDALSQAWLQQKHPGHAHPFSSFVQLLKSASNPSSEYTTSPTSSCTRPLIISVVLAGGFDVVWTDAVSHKLPASAVPSVHAPVHFRSLQAAVPVDSSRNASNQTCTCLMKLSASDSMFMVSSLMRDWHDKCLTVPILQSASLHPTRSKQVNADHCCRPDFDLLYYHRPMSLAGDGPLVIDGIDAQTWWCPKSSVLCQLCSVV